MAFVQAWTDSTPGASVAVTVSVSAGDVLVAWMVADSNDAGDNGPSTWPTGFTHVAAQFTLADGQTLAAGIKVATGSEGALAFSLPSGRNVIGGVAAFSGRDGTTPQDVAAVVVNNDTAQATPWSIGANMTPVTDGCDLVAVMGSDVTATGDAVHTFAGGGLTWTTIADQANGASDFFNVGVGHAVQASAAALTATGTGTLAAHSAGRAMILLALRPAAGGGVTLAGVVAAVSSVAASLRVAKPLGGTVAGASSLTAALRVAKPLAGSVAGLSGLTAALRVEKPLAGTIAGVSVLTAALQVGGAPTFFPTYRTLLGVGR